MNNQNQINSLYELIKQKSQEKERNLNQSKELEELKLQSKIEVLSK